MARILHVEDKEIWRRLVRERLSDHKVDSAASLQEAIELLQAGNEYAVALVDLNLENESDGQGGEMLDLLVARFPATRRIVVTANPPAGGVRKNIFERFDVDEIIIKHQIEIPDLRRVIEEAIDQGPGRLSQDLRFRRSALKQRFRDWEREQGTRLKNDTQNAQSHLEDARRVSSQSGQRAQIVLDEARARETEFRASCARLRELIEAITNLAALEHALEALDAAEEQFGGASAGDGS